MRAVLVTSLIACIAFSHSGQAAEYQINVRPLLQYEYESGGSGAEVNALPPDCYSFQSGVIDCGTIDSIYVSSDAHVLVGTDFTVVDLRDQGEGFASLSGEMVDHDLDVDDGIVSLHSCSTPCSADGFSFLGQMNNSADGSVVIESVVQSVRAYASDGASLYDVTSENWTAHYVWLPSNDNLVNIGKIVDSDCNDKIDLASLDEWRIHAPTDELVLDDVFVSKGIEHDTNVLWDNATRLWSITNEEDFPVFVDRDCGNEEWHIFEIR